MHRNLVLLLLGLATHAQSQIVTDEVVVTATRFAEPLEKTIQHTTVITEPEIRASQAIDVPSLLRREAGIEFRQNGGIGRQSSLFLRGAESDHTLVLIDGVRVDSLTTGATAIDQIMLDQVERIEVVRGNVSSLYGSSAIGGVVQIFTKSGEGKPSGALNLGYGSDNTRSVSGRFGGEADRTRFSLGASHLDTDGFSSIRSEFIPAPFRTTLADLDDDGYRNTSFNAKLSQRLNESIEIGGFAFLSRGDQEFDGAFQNNSESELSAYSAYAQAWLTKNLRSTLTLSQGEDELTSFLDSRRVSVFETTNRQLNWQNEILAGKSHRFVLGLEALEQELESTAAFARTERDVRSAYAGYSGEYGRHGVQLNARHDDYSDFGSETTGLAGYSLGLTPRLRLTASASTAFKAPTFNELFFPSFGNPNLEPEQARSFEIGASYQRGETRARMVYFDSRIRDLILPFPAINVDRAEVDGLELSFSTRLVETDVRASFTYQEPEDEATGLQLLRRAKKFGSLALSRTLSNLRLGAELIASGDRPDVHLVTFERVRVGGYAIVNLTAGYEINRHSSIGLRAENIFDKDYQLVHGFNTQDRALFVNLTLRL